MQNEITIYTDGSSLGNPGPGGWGVIFLANKKALEIGGRSEDTTNNKMELTAAIKALELLGERGVTDYTITIYADSKYVLDGLSKWLGGWKRNGWKKADKKPVLNRELWEQLDSLRDFIETDNKLFLEHVPAHQGEQFNERVDDIARHHAEGKEVELYSGPLDGYLQTD